MDPPGKLTTNRYLLPRFPNDLTTITTFAVRVYTSFPGSGKTTHPILFRQAAIDCQDVPRDEARGIARKEKHSIGHVVRLAQSP